MQNYAVSGTRADVTPPLPLPKRSIVATLNIISFLRTAYTGDACGNLIISQWPGLTLLRVASRDVGMTAGLDVLGLNFGRQ
ncbi:unnamed protein product [Alternaria burnsii]|nr:unnamed protein product [Alternaria burnsii]